MTLPRVLAQTASPDIAECFVRFAGRKRLAGTKHPDATFFLQGRGAAARPQCDLVALDREIEGIASGKAQFVPESLGNDDAARSIEGDFVTHKPILLWLHPFRKWYFLDPDG